MQSLMSFKRSLEQRLISFQQKKHEEGYVVTYKVIEEIENVDKMFDVTYKVSFDSSTSDVSFQCHLFESKGILCRHTLSVLGLERVKKLPNKYILDRWKKTLKRKHSSIKCSHDPSRLEPVKKRYDEMCKQFYDIAKVAAASEELTETVHRILDSIWVMLVEPKASSMDNVDNQNLNEVDENANDLEIHNPQQVSRKGRRRKKRLQSTVEKIVKQGRKKHTKNVKERSHASSVFD
ncbi:hypothetical protein Ahy_B09g095790 isoform C [Arachis hypogaea]|nr:hypothetical protein Ahy_B09g095790 isoform C [Arachis hypogaea]